MREPVDPAPQAHLLTTLRQRGAPDTGDYQHQALYLLEPPMREPAETPDGTPGTLTASYLLLSATIHAKDGVHETIAIPSTQPAKPRSMSDVARAVGSHDHATLLARLGYTLRG